MDNLLSKWNEVLRDIQNLVTAVSYDLYIETLEPLKIDQGRFIVLASTEINKKRLLSLHKDKLLSVIQKYYGNIDDLIVLEPNEKDKFLAELNEDDEEDYELAEFNGKNKLNAKYTFENFVVGKSNQIVYSAALNVAEHPGQNFNPLFIYGGVGLGKTHILNAIGNHIRKNNKDLKLMYATCEQFLNDFTKAIREKTTEEFRRKYREVDVLMIDDIQMISNKIGTQEEFFNTFNDLYQLNKQIVITSDKHPRNMDALEDRLRSRLTSGLIQDIQKPDFETKLAILQSKAEMENYNVDNDVLIYLAEHIDSNIRDLQASLNKVVALAILTRKEKATMVEADEALKDFDFSQTQNLTTDKVIEIVCKYYKVQKSDLIGKKRNKEIVDPRQICMYVMTELLNIPLIAVGNALGGRDHATVIHAREKIASNIKNNKELKTEINDLIAMIKANN